MAEPTSTSRNLLATNGLVGLALVVGIANNVAIAAIFGLTRRVDAFYAAQILPNLFMALSTDYLGRNFLPAFAQARRQSAALASELTSSIVTIVSLSAILVALGLAFFSEPLFGLLLPGFVPADVVLVSRYFWIMAPAIVVMAVTVFHQYVCQHDEDYVFITAAQAVLPLANLVTILAAGRVLGEYALPVGYLGGNLGVFALMARRARYRYRPRMKVRKEWEGKVFFNSAVVMGSGLLARTRSLITNYVGSLLGGGAISALAMATRFTVPVGRTVFMAIKMMMFSKAVRLAVYSDSRDMGRLYQLALGAVFMVLAPLVWWMGLNGSVIVRVLLLRGHFDDRMAALVTLALIGAVPSIVFLNLNTMLSNAFYALQKVAVPALVMPLGTLIYLALAPALARHYGVLGLTASSSAVAFSLFLIMTVLLARRVEGLSALRALGHLMLYTAASGGCVLGSRTLLHLTHVPAEAEMVLGLPAGVLLYGLLLRTIRDPMLGLVCRHLRRAVQPARGVRGALG